MKELVIPGLTASCVSEVYFPGVAVSSDSSIVCDPKENTTVDPSVSMSNLELLGNVAFAMSRSDGSDGYLEQPVILSTTAGGVVMTDNNGQIPGTSVVYIIPAGDGEAAQSFGAMVQQTVEPSAVADGDDVGENGCAPSLSGITNTYFGTLPDSYDDTFGDVRPVQFSVCDAVSGTDEHNDIASSGMEDELSAAIVSTVDNGFVQTADISLDSFSLSLLTNAVSSENQNSADNR